MKPTNIPLARGALGACVALAALGAQAAPATQGEVLDAREAATLLRVPSTIVLKLAASGNIPARRIGKDWRFNRLALMQWLQGERYAYPSTPVKLAAAATADTPVSGATDAPAAKENGALGVIELAAVTGRGASGGQGLRLAQAATPAAVPATTESIGERPSSPSAEDVALRQQGAAILPGGVATLEFGLSYGRRTQEIVTFARVEQSAVTATVTGRYGLKDDLQVTAKLPYISRRSTIMGDLSSLGTGAGGTLGRRDTYAGDLALGLVGVAMSERRGRPNVLLTLDAVLPTGPGDSGLGAGLVVSKSYDPVVIFAGLNYLYGIDIDIRDTRRTLARNNYGFNLGYAYAVNDSIALSGQVAGQYRSPQVRLQSEAVPPEKESYLVQLGMTWQLGRGLYVEPAVAFGVGGAASDLTFSVNVPYTF